MDEKQQLPKISVIIPVLNSVETIEKAIKSVILQDYANVELIILDAGSNDGTTDIIKRYQSSIAYWHSKADGGPYLAINFGAQKATGHLLAQLMADDWFEPNTFAMVANAFVKNPDADILSCGGRIVHYDGKTQRFSSKAVYNTAEQLGLNFYNICFAIPAMSSRFLKKTFIDRIGLFNSIDANGAHIFSADREFLLRTVVHGAKNVIIPHLGHTYLSHLGSATFSKNISTQMRIYQEHMNLAETYLTREDVTKEQKSLLRFWYNDQSVRYFIRKLLQHDFKSSFKIAKKDLIKFKWYWSFALIFTPCSIVASKIISYWQKFKSIEYA